MKEYDCVVIGAGISGLSAAYKMAENRKSVLVLEKNNWIGGRAGTLKQKGFFMDKGAVYIVFMGRTLQKYIKNLGLEDSLVEVSKKAGFFHEGEFQQLDFSSKFSFAKTMAKFSLMKNREKISPKTLFFLANCIMSFRDIRKDYKNLKKYNKESAYSYAKKYIGKETIENIFEPISETFLFAPMKKVSAAIFIVLIGSFVDTSNKMYHIRQGIGHISEKLKKHLAMKKVFVRETEARSIKKKGNKFIVSCRGEKIISKSVISSVPHPNKRIIIPRYSKIMKKEHKKIKYIPMICSSIALKKPLEKLKDNHIGFLKPGKKSPIVFVGEATQKNIHLAPEGRGLLYVLLSTKDSEKFIGMKEKQIDKLIDNELSSIFPDYAGKKMFSKVFKWNNAFILTDKNYFMADKSRTNMDGLFVCGDSVYAGLDGVAESGELAADGALNYLNNN